MPGELNRRIERSIVIGSRRKALISTVSSLEPLEDIERFLSRAETFLYNSDPGLSILEFHYGGWPLKSHVSCDGVEMCELDQASGEFVLDITRSIRYRRIQMEICMKNQAKYDPPSITSYCAVSEGVFDGLAVEGIRYPSPDHMSGWYLTTEQYDKTASSLRVEHLYHVCSQRPELIEFFGLPVGFGFSQQELGGRVYFDHEVAQSDPNP